MPLLEEHARRHARFMKWVLLGVSAICGLCALLFAVARFHPPMASSQRLLYAGAMLVAAWFLAREALGRPGKAEPGLRALAGRPRDIVWCYVFKSKRGTEIVLATVDGVRLGVPIPARRADELLRETAARLPHAVAGYRPDTEATFSRDPRALQRAGA